MTPDDPSGTRPGPVVLRIKLRYDDVDVMVQRFAPNVGKSGLFLPTKSMQPVGSEIKFELRLANDQAVLVGLGRVKVARAPDPDNPKATFGLGVELMRVTRESRDLILRMLERRRQMGLPEIGLPMPADIDAARRSDFIDTSVGIQKADTASGAVPTVPMPQMDSQAERLMTAPRRQTGPIAVAKVHVVEPLAAEPPRPRRRLVSEVIESASGPIAATMSLPGLDDEIDVASALARARSLAVGDLDRELEALRDQAAAPLLEISIEAASAELAKQLGGAAVRRNKSAGWAPPPAISSEVAQVSPAAQPSYDSLVTDAASAITAALTGDVAIAPEPGPTEVEAVEAVEEPQVITEPASEASQVPAVTDDGGDSELDVRGAGDRPERPIGREIERKPRMFDRAPGPDADVEIDPGIIERDEEDAIHLRSKDDPSQAHVPDRITTEPRGAALSSRPLIDDDVDPERFTQRAADVHEVDDAQIADEIHQLSEADFEEVEHTQVGPEPSPDDQAFDDQAYATHSDPDQDQADQDPIHQAALADRLEAHLAEAEAEADADDLGLGAASSYGAVPGPDGLGTPGSFDRALSVGGAYESAIVEEPLDRGNTLDGGTPAPDEELDAEEIDDFEILAEADADDADLLASHGEADASGSLEIGEGAQDRARMAIGADLPEQPPERRSFSDFASRLDLGDESDAGRAAAPESEFDERHAHFGARPIGDELQHSYGVIDPRVLSAGHALAAFDDPVEEPGFDDSVNTGIPTLGRYDTGENSYTHAGDLPPEDPLAFDAPHAGFSSPNQFDQSDVIEVPPELRRDKKATVPPVVAPPPSRRGLPPPKGNPGPEDYDLETALEALDVDLDDLSIPHASTELHRENSKSERIPGRPTIRPPEPASRSSPAPRTASPSRAAPAHQSGSGRVIAPAPVTPSGRAPRAQTDDGILIDFDDEEE